MNSSTPPPPPPSPSLSCPHPTIQLVNKKTPCTYQMSYLIVYMCASATLLATGIWCWVTLPSSKLLELKWNTLYTPVTAQQYSCHRHGRFSIVVDICYGNVVS
ncbi:hypothetical protein Gasu2_41750 [Galdieria sulphuraria]|nr:hypothetical protein Gasu2_41750 [Galdieria sulphuraria]